jgi:autotransporter-associated beta strand protein
LAFCLPGVLVERACAALYTVGDLSPSNFTESYVCAAAGTGQVGWGYNAATSYRGHALLWNGSATAVDLNPTGFTQSYAYGASGTQQVGYGYRPAVHALLWNGTAANYVDLNPTNFTQSYALATDGTRQVGYGYGLSTNSRMHALLWSGAAASYMDLNPSGFLVSEAWGIAGAQQVGNGYTATDSRRHALLWSSTVSAVDLNPSGFTESFAWATNSARQVGQASGPSTNNLPHAMLWSGYAASAVDLTPPGCYQSVARGINGLHQVGFATGAATGYASHAMLWSGSAASALDLNQFLPSGLGNSSATAIDAQGNIAGQAVDASGKTHAVLWQLVAGAWLGGTDGNDWSSPANWNAATITAVPDAPGEKIALGNPGAAPTINLAGADRTVGQVVFNSNVGTNIVTTGQHRLKLDNGSDPALITAAGTHAITAPMTLASNLTVTTTAASDSLSLLGGIGGAKGLTKAGAGTLTLGASNTYTGGTTVLGGTLVISQADALPVGGGLTIGAGGSVVLHSGLSADAGGSGVILGGDATASAVSASIVPEPGTLVLFATLAAASLAWRASGAGVKRSGMHRPRLQS